VIDAQDKLKTGPEGEQKFPPRLLAIFVAWRLRAYGLALASLYAALLIYLFVCRVWLIDSRGMPIYTDFTCAWVAGLLALHGHIASIYDPAEFVKIQATLAVAKVPIYSSWPYPPIFFLIIAPFGFLPYLAAFLSWNILTLVGCVTVSYLIVRRSAAIALVLASPFTFWNFLAGQNGLLTASLFGAALLLLERKPVLAGVFVGVLTYKPHLGILIPVALAASRQWRVFWSACATAAFLTCVSLVAFGAGSWQAFPQGFAVHSTGLLLSEHVGDPRAYWGMLQTVYGLIRYLNGSPALAWVCQGAMTAGIVSVVWLVWRSRVRYPLKAATLSTAALIATPYAFAYDMAVIAIPLAFLASDQVKVGLFRGEQAIILALFAASLYIIVTFGKVPIGPVIMLTLLCLILRRTFQYRTSDEFTTNVGLRAW
jgi:arabinofuranan 3-O-arabinosyltransferase